MNSDGSEEYSEKDFEFFNKELSQYRGRKRYLTDTKISIIKKALQEKYTLSKIAAYFNIN